MTTLAGTKFALSASVPALTSSMTETERATAYAALTWTEDECSLQNTPPLKRSFNGVEDKRVCALTTKTKKGTSSFEPVDFSVVSAWNNTVQGMLETAEASLTDIISVRFTFASGNVVYFTAQVAAFGVTNGGSGDDIDARDVTLWIQSDEITKQAA